MRHELSGIYNFNRRYSMHDIKERRMSHFIIQLGCTIEWDWENYGSRAAY